ncbi:MAG: ribonuclease III domain-containing protein [Caldicoprobacterales bacterium]|jgi:ribonuclease-3 family protein|nr:ribonuclease III domain-containing protein [Clostridia bacterium]MDI9513161.1 ribonuclease III domain-containing protein [Bacillota bacterium]NLH58519.1 Mini-ribonuclease 3 [Clostridiales bacterium]
MLSCIEKITGKDLDRDQVRLLNPLVLAFIGDTVYDLFIRTYLIYNHDLPVHQLHVKASGFVRAGSQSRTLHDIESFLTEDELNIVRRGRNAKSGTIPKNADVTEYRWATGLESLLGYLFLLGQEERICQLFDLILKK